MLKSLRIYLHIHVVNPGYGANKLYFGKQEQIYSKNLPRQAVGLTKLAAKRVNTHLVSHGHIQ